MWQSLLFLFPLSGCERQQKDSMPQVSKWGWHVWCLYSNQRYFIFQLKPKVYVHRKKRRVHIFSRCLKLNQLQTFFCVRLIRITKIIFIFLMPQLCERDSINVLMNMDALHSLPHLRMLSCRFTVKGDCWLFLSYYVIPAHLTFTNYTIWLAGIDHAMHVFNIYQNVGNGLCWVWLYD